MANKYEVQRESKILGSFTSAELREMASEGEIFKDDLIRKAGSDGKWSEASSVKSLEFQTKQSDPVDVTSTIGYELNEDSEEESSYYSGETTKRQADMSSKFELPGKVRELIHDDEQINYASRPSKSALIISMVVYGFVFGIISLGLLAPFALLFSYLSWKNTYYVITDGRTIVMSGIFNVATKIILNENIQLISINTGIIDRWLKLNSIELSTAAQGGGVGGIFGFFPGMSQGCVTLKQVDVTDVIKHYAQL